MEACVPAGQHRARLSESRDSHLSLSPQTIWALFSVLSTHTHTHISTMHQWELVVTVEMAGDGRATDASFSTFVSLCVFHLPTSLHPSLPPFVIPPSPPSVSSYLTYFLSSIPFCFPPFLLYFYLPHVTRLSFIRAIMFRPAGSSHSSPHPYPRPPALSHMLALTSTIALDQRWSFFSTQATLVGR